jgi:hypothetical protein
MGNMFRFKLTPSADEVEAEDAKYKRNSNQKKHVVAVDLDEVLGGFLPALTIWHNRLYNTSYTLADYKSYAYCDLWGGTNEATVIKVHQFFDSDEFRTGVRPLPNAKKTLEKFRPRCTFHVVTSRQTVISKDTLKWLELHFKGIFSDVHFGNHYDLKAPDPDSTQSGVIKRSKPDMCQDINAVALIDDSAKYVHSFISTTKDIGSLFCCFACLLFVSSCNKISSTLTCLPKIYTRYEI